jgi:hypothetical protein
MTNKYGLKDVRTMIERLAHYYSTQFPDNSDVENWLMAENEVLEIVENRKI